MLRFATTACLGWGAWLRQLDPSLYRILCPCAFVLLCGVGVVCYASFNQVSFRDYPMMLSVFSNMLAKESDLRVIDNLCAALCRMILSNVDAVPLEQVCPTEIILACSRNLMQSRK